MKDSNIPQMNHLEVLNEIEKQLRRIEAIENEKKLAPKVPPKKDIRLRAWFSRLLRKSERSGY